VAAVLTPEKERGVGGERRLRVSSVLLWQQGKSTQGKGKLNPISPRRKKKKGRGRDGSSFVSAMEKGPDRRKKEEKGGRDASLISIRRGRGEGEERRAYLFCCRKRAPFSVGQKEKGKKRRRGPLPKLLFMSAKGKERRKKKKRISSITLIAQTQASARRRGEEHMRSNSF